MKNKRAIYILVPLLISIWGIIAYQITSYGSPDNGSSFSGQLSVPKIENAKADTFSISANYRDPFLEKPVVEKKPVVVVKKAKPEVKASLPWPKITYGGVIKNQKSSKQLYLVQVNGNDNIIREGDLIAEVQLAKAWKDSIQVVFQKERRVIKK